MSKAATNASHDLLQVEMPQPKLVIIDCGLKAAKPSSKVNQEPSLLRMKEREGERVDD
jgi:hypothetical protein